MAASDTATGTAAETETGPGYDPYAPATQVDPYPAYRWLRAHSPVHFVEKYGFWVLTRYADVYAAAPSKVYTAKLGVSQRDPFPDNGEGLPPYAYSVITTDPPEHTSLRRMLQKVFGAKAQRTWPPRIQKVADRLVAELVESARDGAGDVAGQLARPLPAAVVCELMCLPLDDMSTIARWSDDALALLPGAEAVGTEVAMRAGQSGAELAAYITELIADRRTRPLENDLISDLLAVRDDTTGEPMSDHDLVGNLVTMVLAGLETTGGLISNGSAALLAHPEEFRKLRDDPDLLGPAIEEMLRYDAPSQGNFRTVTADVTVRGTVIPAGSRVQLMWGAANRDEDRFDDGERFRIDRPKPASHVSFGTGMHFCLGALLARFQSTAAFSALLAQTAEIEPAGQAEVNTVMMPILRGHARVPITAR